MDFKERMGTLMQENPFISKTEIVYTLMLDEILLGGLKGGHRINQEELSAQLGISRSPVREALNRLVTEGYLVKEGASGYYIYNLKLEDYMMINEFRSMFELFAAELAVKNITSEMLQQLKKNVAATKKAVGEGDMRAFIVLDEEFHKLLICATHNPYIIRTYEEYAQKFHLFRILSLTDEVLRVALRWHKMIYDAIIAGDAEGAINATRLHRDNTVSGALMKVKGNQMT